MGVYPPFKETRHKFVQWYVLIVGGLLAFLFRDVDSLPTSLQNEAHYIILCFLLLYSIFADLYLLVQKRNYKAYNDRILQIEKDFCNFELDRSPTRVVTASRIYYTMVTLIGAGITFLLSYAIYNSILWGGLTATVYMILLIAISFIRPFAH